MIYVHVLDVQAFFESSNRLTSVNRLTSLPGPPLLTPPQGGSGDKDSPGVLINFQFNRLTSVRFHLDGLASIILQINGLTAIRFHLHVLKYKYSSNRLTSLPGPPRRGGKENPGVLIILQITRNIVPVRFHLDGLASIILQITRNIVPVRFHLDGLASIILQINGLTAIRFHLHVLKYKHSSNHFSIN